jgi:hypothetical protein
MDWPWCRASSSQTRIIVVIWCLKCRLVGVAVAVGLALSSVGRRGFNAMTAAAYARLTSSFVGRHAVKR